MEWAIEVCKETGKAVASTMCIGPKGDIDGVPASECAVRMARAGSNVGKLTKSQMLVHLNEICKVHSSHQDIPINLYMVLGIIQCNIKKILLIETA